MPWLRGDDMKHISIIIAIVCLVTLAALAGIQRLAGAQSQAACYTQAGAVKVVAGSGCEYEFQSGAVLDIQAGATAVIPASILGQSGVLQYATPGKVLNCTQSTITDTLTLTSSVTAITTPSWATCTMNTITADAEHCAAAVGTPGSILVIVRNSALTPVANGTGAAVTVCTGGTN